MAPRIAGVVISTSCDTAAWSPKRPCSGPFVTIVHVSSAETVFSTSVVPLVTSVVVPSAEVFSRRVEPSRFLLDQVFVEAIHPGEDVHPEGVLRVRRRTDHGPLEGLRAALRVLVEREAPEIVIREVEPIPSAARVGEVVKLSRRPSFDRT
jgi:hypothetical protein